LPRPATSVAALGKSFCLLQIPAVMKTASVATITMSVA
jgi:hypothetical protein